MELKYLYTMKKIIQTGSYQDTAAALNYAPSTISFQVKELERELGVQLFEKRNGRMVLTGAGRELQPLADDVIESAGRLLSFWKEREQLSGMLNIALPESLMTYCMQPVLKRFKEKAPLVQLSLRVMNCFAIQKQFSTGDIDIAIHYAVGKYKDSVEVIPLCTYPLVLVGSAELSEAERDFITRGQSKHLCHIQNDRDALYLKIFNTYLKQREITLEKELEVWSIESIKRSVISNLGVAYLPRFCVEEELESGVLLEIPTQIADGQMTAICAYDRSRWYSPALSLFLEILNDHFAPVRNL